MTFALRLALFLAVGITQSALALPSATHTDVRYGPKPRNLLDLWLADSDQPTPLLISIHGGGFAKGDKARYHHPDLILPYLEAGISVATINYTLTDGGKHPFPEPMMDGVRAIQFLRSKALDFNLDKSRFAAMGSSAGACMLMWIGFHDDLADPDSLDPVEHESTRLLALAPINGQSTLHLPTLNEWFGVPTLREHPALRPLFNIPRGEDIEFTDELDTLMREASPITFLSADDPPIYMTYGRDSQVTEESEPNVWVHHPTLGRKLKEAADAIGVECHVQVARDRPEAPYQSQSDFLIKKLKDG